jgi:hypothetical protein
MPGLFTRAAVALAATFALGTPSTLAYCEQAPAVSAPSAEAEALGVEATHILYQEVDFRALAQGKMGDIDHIFDDIKDRPDWPRFMREAALEEMDQLRPTMERAVGKAFAKYFTLEELRAGVSFLRGPGGPGLAHVVAETAAGRPAPTMAPEVKSELEKLARRPAGHAFLEKFSKMDALMASVTPEVTPPLILGLLRRFTDKAQAAEPPAP